MNNTCFICPPCRNVARANKYGERFCASCNAKMIKMSPAWKAPKKKDAAAWEQIQLGNYKYYQPLVRQAYLIKAFNKRGKLKLYRVPLDSPK